MARRYHTAYDAPMIAAEILVLINPLTHWIYYFDENRNFVRNKGENAIYIVSVLYFIIAVILILIVWKAMDYKKQKTLIYFFVMVTSGMIIQLLQPTIHIELFMESLAVLGILITVENEDDRMNRRTGAYNERAFAMDIRSYMGSRHPISLIILKMMNPQSLMQTIGPMNIENLTIMNIEYLRTVVADRNIYYLNPGTFIILNDEMNPEKDMEMAQTIHDRFLQEWSFQGRETVFHAGVFYVEIPKDFKSREQLMALVGSPMIKDVNSKGFASFAFPELKNSKTGVSVRYVPVRRQDHSTSLSKTYMLEEGRGKVKRLETMQIISLKFLAENVLFCSFSAKNN
jgi:hypothetical protein